MSFKLFINKSSPEVWALIFNWLEPLLLKTRLLTLVWLVAKLRAISLSAVELNAALCELVGRSDEARALFEEMLSHRTHAGLLSEDIDVHTGELWGNFPQTYSLVGIVNAAMRLSKPWESAL